VWQDFQFACGQYPAHKEFLATVEAEAKANVKRLRGHPSLALWCGNNEGIVDLTSNLGVKLIYLRLPAGASMGYFNPSRGRYLREDITERSQ
jgi:hypothetical protein